MRNMQVDGQRLWQSLVEMAKIGETAKGGVCRLALSEVDKNGRDLFVRWCEEAGLTVRVDEIGNIFARRPGRLDERSAIGTGSHLDSQPTGGKFDGVYGVLAGLEVIRTLNDHRVETDAPVELAMWTNEEGARFDPAMMGSGVYAGVFSLESTWEHRDREGASVEEALTSIGYKGSEKIGEHRFGAFFEAHIEQGPILENENKTIGIVSGVQGIRWYDVIVTGDEAHAGPTPMSMRRDALAGAVTVIPRIYDLALDRPPFGRATVGDFHSEPASRNTVPGVVRFSVDLRHPDEGQLAEMDAGLKAVAASVVGERGLACTVNDVWYSPPVTFDPQCVAAVGKGAELMGYSSMEIVSGAGHDAVYVSRTAPTGMIFIPCKDGISHNEIESATPEDVEAGANVLLHAMLECAQGTEVP
jgi:N-carbamoyl-L-amino-acid hydrolase